jgi:hypothetical protein
MTAEDLARVRLLPAAGPIAETMHSLAALPRRSGRSSFDPWRQRVHAAAGPTLATVGALAPPHAVGLDLLGICGVRDSFDEGIEALLEAEPGVLRIELDHLERIGVRLPVAFADLRDADSARHRLAEELRRYYRLAVEPVLLHPAMPAAPARGRSAAGLIRSSDAVEKLVGRTRATVLSAIAGGTTTTGGIPC